MAVQRAQDRNGPIVRAATRPQPEASSHVHGRSHVAREPKGPGAGASKGIGLETSHLNGDAIFIDGGYTAL